MNIINENKYKTAGLGENGASSMLKGKISNQMDGPVKTFKIPEKVRKKIDYERLLRMPKHKPQRPKYDKNSLVTVKTVNVQTKEDNFNLFDMPWISNLRVMDKAEEVKLSKKVSKESTVPAPPSFYEDDLQKLTQKTKLTKKVNHHKFS